MFSVCVCSLLGLIVAELVIDLIFQRIGQILLLDIMMRIIVGIKIMLTFYSCALAVIMLILQMTWKIQCIT